MDDDIKWKDVKNSMTSLSDKEKKEIDLISEIIAKIIESENK